MPCSRRPPWSKKVAALAPPATNLADWAPEAGCASASASSAQSAAVSGVLAGIPAIPIENAIRLGVLVGGLGSELLALAGLALAAALVPAVVLALAVALLPVTALLLRVAAALV